MLHEDGLRSVPITHRDLPQVGSEGCSEDCNLHSHGSRSLPQAGSLHRLPSGSSDDNEEGSLHNLHLRSGNMHQAGSLHNLHDDTTDLHQEDSLHDLHLD
jgi:hypothetical protein